MEHMHPNHSSKKVMTKDGESEEWKNDYSSSLFMQEQLCPAKDLCRLLGETLCDRQAFQDEPYYAPNIVHHSGQSATFMSMSANFATPGNISMINNDTSHTGILPTAPAPAAQDVHLQQKQQQTPVLYQSPVQVRRHYQRLLHSQPCNPVDLKQSRAFCISSLQNCFQGQDDLLQEMIDILCETHTCHSHLQMLYSNIESVHVLKHKLDMHQNDLEKWGFKFWMILCLGLGYILWNNASARWMTHDYWKRRRGMKTTTTKMMRGQIYNHHCSSRQKFNGKKKLS
jgi:hypothetical protein